LIACNESKEFGATMADLIVLAFTGRIKPRDGRSIFSVILGTDGGTLGVLQGVPSGGRGQSRASSCFILRLKIDHMTI
jgi:hypothetical protein